MNPFLTFRGWGRNPHRGDRKSRAGAKLRSPRRARLECLEDRRLLTWIASFANPGGTLIISGQGTSSDTGVLKVDAATGEILLDGNNSGNFSDTGANLATLTAPIQINANTTINSNFIIDNGAGAFFEAPSSPFFPVGTPLFNYTGSSARNPNAGLTIRGVQGVADTFEVALNATSNGGAKNTTGVSQGEAGTVMLTEPPNALNQQNRLMVTFGPNIAVPNSTGITGSLSLDGADPQGGNDQLFIDDQGATISAFPGLPAGTPAVSNWTLNGNTIQGPQFPNVPAAGQPPVPPFAAGTVGNITYSNIANLQFNDNTAGDLLTINSVGTSTTASTSVANYTVVNANQPLAFPVNLVGIQNSPNGNLNIAGAVNGNNSIFVNSNSVSLAAAGTKPQYNTPFTHLGADLTYTEGSLKTMSVAGNGGSNIVTVQVPPTLIAPYTSDTLPATFTVYGGALPPPAPLTNGRPIPVIPGSTLLRVFGNAAGNLTTGADSISVGDLGAAAGGGGTAGATNIQMSGIAGVVLYGEGGNDTLTNNSKGNAAIGLLPVSALFIPGNGNATLVGGAGSDMFLGGDGQYTVTSSAVSTPAKPTTTYFFPHQDQFGNIYDPLLNPADGTTTSMLTGVGGNQIVVTGAVDPAVSSAIDPTTGDTVGDLDTGNLANPGVGGAGGGGGGANGGQTISYPTVPPSNVTAPLYMATDALTALEGAMGIGRGPFPANAAAVLEFGRALNLRTQFASAQAFAGRAYNDFLADRGGGGTFGAVSGGSSNSNAPVGGAIVSPQEIANAAAELQNGMSVETLQAGLLASNELRGTLPEPSMWIRFLYESVTGVGPTQQQLMNGLAVLAGPNDTQAARFNIALELLNSSPGQMREIQDAYSNVVPGALGSASPSPTDLAAIQADLAGGETLLQVAQTMGLSSGNYLNYEVTNNIGTVGYVANVYQSILHRPASASDLNYWAAARGAGLSAAGIAMAVLSSPEAKMYVVTNTFQRYLDRSPSAGDMSFWVSQLTSGLSNQQFVAVVASSPEYYARHGGTSVGYVTGLYQDILRRTNPPGQADVDYWVTLMAATPANAVQARASVAYYGFQQSPEYEADLVNGWYQAFYGRLPTAAEAYTAQVQFNSGYSEEQVEAQILASHASIS